MQTIVTNTGIDENVVIFCSDVALKVLAESKRWWNFWHFCAIKEDKFQQFYLVHGLYKSHLKPCLLALLTNRPY